MVSQYLDLASGQYYNVEAGFVDPETGNYVIEKLPSSRLDLKVDGSSEAEPSLWEGFSGGRTGFHRGYCGNRSNKSRNPGKTSSHHSTRTACGSDPGRATSAHRSRRPGWTRLPTHTGGNQTELGPRTDQPTGYPAQEQEPLIHISPDDREELRKFQALLLASVPVGGPGLPAGLTEADLKPAKSDENPPVLSTPGHAWTPTEKLSEIDNMLNHYGDHAGDFSDISSVFEYVEATHAFINNPPEGVLAKIRENGDILLYHKDSNTFAVRDVNGVPRTMFKPKPRIKYWHAQ